MRRVVFSDVTPPAHLDLPALGTWSPRRRQGEELLHLRGGEVNSRDLAIALTLTVLSELCFMSYARAYDSLNLLGHLYLVASSYAVFHALFGDAVIRPYERLGATTRDLAASNAELRRLRRHVEDELDVTIRNLEALQEQRENYLRAASHDLRIPLQVLLLEGEVLARAAAPGTSEQRRASSRRTRVSPCTWRAAPFSRRGSGSSSRRSSPRCSRS